MLVLVRLAYNALRLVTWPLWVLLRRLRKRRAPWVVLRVRGHVVEVARPRMALLRSLVTGFRPPPLSVSKVRKLREQLVADPDVQGLLVYVGSLEGGWAALTSLRHELAHVRAGGKRVVCFLPHGGSQREIYLASVADTVVAPKVASFSALGPMAARAYVAPLLEKVGVRVEVLAQGAYKTAAEPLVRDTMSEAEREQLTAIVTTLADAWIDKVGERPKLGQDGARKLFETAYFGGERALELGLVDVCCYEDELAALLELPPKRRPLAAAAYMAAARRPLFVPLRPPKRVAIVRLEGAITEQPTGVGGVALPGATAVLRALVDEPTVAGVILHIDSPGGSAVASDLIHREVRRLDAKKPVVAWLGNVAASGGYYLAAGCRHVVAQPTTLTGSIGVISARPTAATLFEKLGVRQEIVKLTPHADLHSLTRELDDGERTLLLDETRRFYERFLAVVCEGRSRPRESIEPLAGGRVWSGRDAHAHGLVDTLGGYAEARAALDALLREQQVTAHAEPVIVSLPRREVTPNVPARSVLGELSALSEHFARAHALWDLCRGGERVLAYALDLPRLD